MGINKYRYLNCIYRNKLVLNSIERKRGGRVLPIYIRLVVYGVSYLVKKG